MDDKPHANPIAGCLILAVILAAVALYPLSAGPAVKLVNYGLMSSDAFVRIYNPLMRLDDRVFPKSKPFTSYMLRWADPLPNPPN